MASSSTGDVLNPSQTLQTAASMGRRATAERSVTARRAGSRLVVLVSDNHATKLAVKMACSLLRPRDELQLLTVVMSDSARAYGEKLLSQYTFDGDESNFCTPIVLVKPDHQRLSDVIGDHVLSSGAQLLVCGSHNLCISGGRDNPMPASGSFCLRLVKAISSCPVLVVKVNSKGPYLKSDNLAMGLKCMVSLQSNSRHLLGWLMSHMDPERDGIFLAASKAFDQATGKKNETATRMLTNFSVQAAVNDFYSVQRAFKNCAHTSLPKAVEDDSIDILAVAAPACRFMPQSIIDLLHSARSSVLIYHQPADAAAAAAGVETQIGRLSVS